MMPIKIECSTDLNEIYERVPQDWIDDVGKIKYDKKKYLPIQKLINLNGEQDTKGEVFFYLKSPLRFCLNCGVTYGPRQRSDFSKLSSLGSEGRSSATTILSLSAIRHLKQIDKMKPKILSFTDNRQDASLQAGHFNDFIEVGLIRSALYKACLKAGDIGIEHDELAQAVFKVFNIDGSLFVENYESLRTHQKKNAEKAMREVIAYRIYRDQKRGWRIIAPNLEQCGLLKIKYPDLSEICQDEKEWSDCHAALQKALPETREKICTALLDYLRSELAISVDYLEEGYQERIQQQSSQYFGAR